MAVVVIGLILLVLAALLVTAIVTGPAHPFDVELFGFEMATSNVGLFFSGVAVGGGVLVALLLIRAGLLPRRRGHRDRDADEPADAGHPTPHDARVPHEVRSSAGATAARPPRTPTSRHAIDRDTAA